MISTVVLVAIAALYLLVFGVVLLLRRLTRRGWHERDAVLEQALAAKSQRLRDRQATQRLDEGLRQRTARRRVRAASLRARAAEIETGPARPPHQHKATRPAEVVLLRRPDSAA